MRRTGRANPGERDKGSALWECLSVSAHWYELSSSSWRIRNDWQSLQSLILIKPEAPPIPHHPIFAPVFTACFDFDIAVWAVYSLLPSNKKNEQRNNNLQITIVHLDIQDSPFPGAINEMTLLWQHAVMMIMFTLLREKKKTRRHDFWKGVATFWS